MNSIPPVHLRPEFVRQTLHRSDLASEPLEQLRRWLAEAGVAQVPDPQAFTLATVRPDGTPAARTVLLKAIDPSGLVFTSSESPKTDDLRRQPGVAAVFYWPVAERQVRVTGQAHELTRAESQKLYDVRPHDQRLALLTFPQSGVIADRATLDGRFEALQREHAGRELPLPTHWGGWRIVPAQVEFWQGGVNRLHDRFLYTAQAGGPWHLERLAP